MKINTKPVVLLLGIILVVCFVSLYMNHKSSFEERFQEQMIDPTTKRHFDNLFQDMNTLRRSCDPTGKCTTSKQLITNINNNLLSLENKLNGNVKSVPTTITTTVKSVPTTTRANTKSGSITISPNMNKGMPPNMNKGMPPNFKSMPPNFKSMPPNMNREMPPNMNRER
jgi:hypothetical protein